MSLVHGYDTTLFQEAREECLRSRKLAESDDPGDSAAGPAVAAIVLSESTVEAFVSEALAVLKMAGTLSSGERESIRDHDGFYRICRAFHDHFSERHLHRKPVYSNALVPLVKLRHCVVHRSADTRGEGEWPKKIAPYSDVIRHVSGTGLHWTSQLFTAPTATWAVGAAFRSRQELHGVLPRESMREKFYHAVSTWVLKEPDVS